MNSLKFNILNKLFNAIDSDDIEALAIKIKAGLSEEMVGKLINSLQNMMIDDKMEFDRIKYIKLIIDFLTC